MPNASTQTRRGKKIVLIKKPQKGAVLDAHIELYKKYRKLKAETEAKQMLQSAKNYEE